jgi:anti-anti-sigma factor
MTNPSSTISTVYYEEPKTLVVEFHWGSKGIPGFDFAEIIKKPLFDAISNNDVETVILDLEKLTTISSEWLWLLLWPTKYLKEKWVSEPKVIITNPNQLVSKVLHITNLKNILDIRDQSSNDILSTLQSNHA